MRKGYHGPLRRAREMLPGRSPLNHSPAGGESCTETYISVGEKFSVRLTGAVGHGFAVQNVPHIFFFCLQKRKRAGHGTKEKALGDELTRKGPTPPNEGAIGTDCWQSPEASYRLRRWVFLAELHSHIWEYDIHRGAKRMPPAPLSAGAPTHLWDRLRR